MNEKRYQRLKETEEGRGIIADRRRSQYLRQKGEGWLTRAAEIVAIDGEGFTDDSGHRFVMLAASTGDIIRDAKGLGTYECLQFLTSLHGKGRRILGFALGYDINQILKDLPLKQLEKLKAEEEACYKDFAIQWTPHKCLRVTDYSFPQRKKTVTIWDVFGFYQTSFVKALKEWGVGTPEEIALIEGMKMQRSVFTDDQWEEIERYNNLECKLLVELAKLLEQTLIAAEIRLCRWDGAGAIAGALLRKYGVKQHLPSHQPPTEAVMSAYYGGRIQALAIGKFRGPIFNYDVNSAYPAVTATLPSLCSGQWEEVSKFDPDAEFALWDCTWNIGEKNPQFPLTPFPWRSTSGHIVYPSSGSGYYWHPLVKVAKAAWGAKVKINRGWVYRSPEKVTPFEWVEELYQIRKVYKREKDPRHIILKLGLNSLYGKFAQGIGFRDQPPPYQCYIWAGIITNTTQAKLLAAALNSPEDMIAFATDGIFCRKPLPLDFTDRMGEWEGAECERLFLVQPGLYAYDKEGKTHRKTRGFRPDELDYAALMKVWDDEKYFGKLTIQTRRFIGLKLALHMKRLHHWRNFVPAERVITCAPGRGFPGPVNGDWMYWLPESIPTGKYPAQYTPKKKLVESDRVQALQLSNDLEQPEIVV